MALSEQSPRPSSRKTHQEHDITLFVGEDRHPVQMASYDQERFYIGGLRANLESIKEGSIVFAVKVETARKGWITRRYDLTGEQFCHLLYGSQQPAPERVGILEATTRLRTPQPHTSGRTIRKPSGH